ncbi:type II secretion system protein [Psychrobacillus sp. FSL H8-0483]|uniref:type II secretion system protein n=1 Tax=Psychrobacillus sp. FSL H8-0483 TaxID=2921389 RepID=UPI00315AEED2
MKKFTKILKNQKGLTLIELLAVIVILAIVAAIAVPSIGNIVNNSKDKAILSEASNVIAGAKIAVTEEKCSTTTANNITTTTCSSSNLLPYVEGITFASSGDQVVKTVAADNTTTWTLTYAKLGKIKNTTKFTGGGFTPGAANLTITETQLNTILTN